MIRIFSLELKRVLKTRSTWFMLALCLLLSILLAVMVLTVDTITHRDLSPAYKGLEAVRIGNAIEAPFTGTVTPELLREANDAYRAVYEQYGEEVPNAVYQELIWKYRPFINLMGAVYVDEATGYTLSPIDIEPAWAEAFYEQRRSYIEDKIAGYELRRDPAAQAQVLAIDDRVELPLYFAPHHGWDTGGEYIHLLTFLLILLCTAVAAPVFSSDYQTEADSIQRCTKNGRAKLAVVKLAAMLLLTLVVYAVCMGIFMLILCTVLGTDGLQTSVQFIITSAISPLTMGQLNGITILSGLLTMLSVTGFTLLVSSRSKTPLVTMIVGFTVILAPTLLRVLSSVNIMEWFRFAVPSGGTGLGNSIYYELTYNVTFLRLGPVSIWSPYVILGAAAVWCVLSIPLAVVSYCRHEV